MVETREALKKGRLVGKYGENKRELIALRGSRRGARRSPGGSGKSFIPGVRGKKGEKASTNLERTPATRGQLPGYRGGVTKEKG